jgi:predicted nuclease with TOPRIM domain
MSEKQDDIFNMSVTELLLIIMFSLLVAMVLLNSTLQGKVDEHAKDSQEYTKLIDELKNVNDKLGLDREVIEPASMEINEAVAQMQALVKALKKSVESESAQEVLAKMKLNDVWTSLSKLNEENIDIPELLPALKDLNESLEDYLKQNEVLTAKLEEERNLKEDYKEQLEQLHKELSVKESLLAQTKEENENLTGQVANLSNGLEFPPCWATQNGKAEYTYLVTVHDDALEVSSIYPESRRADYFLLISKDFDNEFISSKNFKNQLNVFYSTAIKRTPECRFFVQIKDATSLDSKMEYKLGLKTVESIFYKYLLQ